MSHSVKRVRVIKVVNPNVGAAVSCCLGSYGPPVGGALHFGLHTHQKHGRLLQITPLLPCIGLEDEYQGMVVLIHVVPDSDGQKTKSEGGTDTFQNTKSHLLLRRLLAVMN